jgi:hypothetical protein
VIVIVTEETVPSSGLLQVSSVANFFRSIAKCSCLSNFAHMEPAYLLLYNLQLQRQDRAFFQNTFAFKTR